MVAHAEDLANIISWSQLGYHLYSDDTTSHVGQRFCHCQSLLCILEFIVVCLIGICS